MSKVPFVYVGIVGPDEVCAVHVLHSPAMMRMGKELTPHASARLWDHSPTGFNWGYQGSGPAQLALAILLEATGDAELAVHHHQEFKRQVVCRFPQGESWALTADQVQAWVEREEKLRPVSREGNDDSGVSLDELRAEADQFDEREKLRKKDPDLMSDPGPDGK